MVSLEQGIAERRSIRKFRAGQIPQDLLREILDLARWAPSWGNTQCWSFYAMTGTALEGFKKSNREKLAQGNAYSPDIPMPESWPDEIKRRYGETGRLVLGSLAIERSDAAGRTNFYEEMASLFGATCLVVGCIPRDVRIEYAMLDMGLVIQTICLAAHAKGIGSCIMAASVGYPDLLRKACGIPEDVRIAMGVALGYADTDHPVNAFTRPRLGLDEMVHWIA